MNLGTDLHRLSFRGVDTQARQCETSLAHGHVCLRLVSCSLNVKVSFLLYVNIADSPKEVCVT